MAEKIVSLYQPQMSYAAQIVEVSELFFNEHPELDAAAQEVLAGETVPTVLNAFKEKLTAMTTVDAPTVKAAIKRDPKRNRNQKAKTCLCQFVLLSQDKRTDQNYRIQ